MPKYVEDGLMDLCITGDEQKMVVVDFVYFISSGMGQEMPVQILVLKNLVSKLLRNNSHHNISLIKDLSEVLLLKEFFELVQQRTASNHSMEDCLDPGINCDASSRQLSSLQVARIYKYLQARKFKDGSLRLLG